MCAIEGEIQEGTRSRAWSFCASMLRRLNPFAPLDLPKTNRLDLTVAKPIWPEQSVVNVPAIAGRRGAAESLVSPLLGSGVVVGLICAAWFALASFVHFVNESLKSAILYALRVWEVVKSSSTFTRGLINGPSGAADAARLYAFSSHA